MDRTIDRGIAAEGVLPGGLNVRRRAPGIHRQLIDERGRNLVVPHVSNDWLSVYAMAVNEENAAGGQVVTAPTNGAAGVVPAVLRYYRDHIVGSTAASSRDMLLTAAAIGGLVKHNASISGAECGCQAEVGSAAAMAAGALCGALGGTPAPGRERRRDCPRAPSRHDLRPDPRPRPRCPASSATASAPSRPSRPPRWR